MPSSALVPLSLHDALPIFGHRLGGGRRRGRPAPAVRQLLRHVRGRRRERGGPAGRRAAAAPGRPGRKGDRMRTARLFPVLALALAIALPWSTLDIPVLFDGPLNSPGTLQLLGVCLVFGGLALGYDLLFGHAGLLSFGHALFIAAGAYTVGILLDRFQWPLWTAAVLAVAGAAVAAALLGAVALRVSGIA